MTLREELGDDEYEQLVRAWRPVEVVPEVWTEVNDGDDEHAP